MNIFTPTEEEQKRRIISKCIQNKEEIYAKQNWSNNLPNITLEEFFNNYQKIRVYGPSLETFGKLPSGVFEGFLERNGTIELLLTERLKLDSKENPSLVSKYFLKYHPKIVLQHIDKKIFEEETMDEKRYSLITVGKGWFKREKVVESKEQNQYEIYFITGDEQSVIMKRQSKDPAKSYITVSFNNEETTNKFIKLFYSQKN